jgi:filamentous hemagglutinin family protein
MVAAGAATVNVNGSAMTVNQGSQRAVLDWAGFGIKAGETVNFVQPSSNSVVLNRVLGSDPSNIFGNLNANGQVILTNPNGILFGRGASVNVNGLVASTQGISKDDFLAGRNHFSGTSAASVTNQGNINTADGGYIALIARSVNNEGRLSARFGSVLLGAGDQATMDMGGDGLLRLSVDKGAARAAIRNTGSIQADGGMAILSAQAADDLAGTAVNNTGLVRAQTVENRGGTIVLLAGKHNGSVNLAGTLDASAPGTGNGGSIETSAASVQIADGAQISTKAAQGMTGSWLIDPTDFTISTDTAPQTSSGIGSTTLQNALATSDVAIATDTAGTQVGDIMVQGNVHWIANKLTLTAAHDVNVSGVMTASGAASLDIEPGSGKLILASTSIANPLTGTFAGSGDNGRIDFGGSGSLHIAHTKYTILQNVTDLQNIKLNLAGTYAMGSDIDASALSTFARIADNVTPFTGKLNGLGHVIKQFTQTQGGATVGLFGTTAVGSVISNFGFWAPKVTGSGSLVANTNRGDIRSVFLTPTYLGSTITANLGLANTFVVDNYGTISNSYAYAGLVQSDPRGVFVTNNFGTISKSWAFGIKLLPLPDSLRPDAAFVAYNAVTGIIDQSISFGTMVAGNLQAIVGIFVGQNDGLITNSYSSGRWGAGAGTTTSGGFVGINNGTIRDSYANSTFNVSNLLGNAFAGINTGLIERSYYNTTNLKGRPAIGSDTSTLSPGYPLTGLSPAGMMQQASFQPTGAGGWDFNNTWVIYEGHTAPLLRAFMTDLTVAGPDSSLTYDSQQHTGSGSASYSRLSTTNKLLGSPVYAYGTGTNADSYANTVSGLYSTQFGYIYHYVDGALTISKATLTATGNSLATTYDGGVQSISGFTVSGLQGRDTVASLMNVSARGAFGQNAGAYINTVTVGPETNYIVTPVNGNLDIGKATATVIANSGTVTYNGADQRVNGFTATGLVGVDTAASLTGVTAGGTGQNAGVYAAIVTGTDANYTLTFVDGTLAINRAPLILEADNQQRLYGTANPPLTQRLIGLMPGDTASLVTGQAGASTSADLYTLPGIVPIRANPQLLSDNYQIVQIKDGTLTINTAPEANAVMSLRARGLSDTCFTRYGDVLLLQLVNQGIRLPNGSGFIPVKEDLSVRDGEKGQFESMPRSGNNFQPIGGVEQCKRSS